MSKELVPGENRTTSPGRATDDASNEIRHGRMTREQGIELVAQYDHVRPYDMDIFLQKSGMTEQQLLDMVAPMRDPALWEKDAAGQWRAKDSVANHARDEGVAEARLPDVAKWQPFKPTPSRAAARYQEDGSQHDYVLL